MARTKISEFSATPANNTDIDSINLAEGCAPSGINDAIRELMAQLKDFQTGAVGDSFNGPVGTTTAAAGAFTTLSASSTVSGTGFSTYLASPPAIGGTAAAAGSFTTLSASGNVTLSGGTANGVAYLNGSKVVTSGSALTFDGTSLGVKAATTEATNVNIGGGRSGSGFAYLDLIGDAAQAASYSARLIRGNGGANATTSLIHKGTGALEFTASDAGYLTYNINGTEQMRLTSTGLGIGTSSPSSKLDIVGVTQWQATAGTVLGKLTYSGGEPVILANTGLGLRFFTNNTQTAILDSAGNLGIGTSSPSQKLDVRGNMYMAATNARIYIDNGGVGGSSVQIGASGTSYGYIGTDGSFPLVFQPNNTERMRLDSSGNLGIGTSSPTVKLEVVSGAETLRLSRSTSGSVYLGFAQGGTRKAYLESNNADVNLFAEAASSNMIFGTVGTERARIDASGNLGLGVTPSAWDTLKAIQLSGGSLASFSTYQNFLSANAFYQGGWKYVSTATAGQYLQDGNVHKWYTAPSGTAGNAITFTQAMTLDASGNLQVGTTTGSARMTLAVPSAASTARTALSLTDETQASVSFILHTDLVRIATGGSDALAFETNGSERARIDSSGNLLVGTTSNGTGDKVRIASAQATSTTLSLVSTDDQSGGTYVIFRNSAQTAIASIARVATTNSVSYNTTSDYRLKTITGNVTGQGARIDALKPVDYLWKEGNQQARGFLAHEFQTVYPNSVTGDKDAVDADGNPVYQAMQASTAEVIADLVAEIQSLRKRLADAGI